MAKRGGKGRKKGKAKRRTTRGYKKFRLPNSTKGKSLYVSPTRYPRLYEWLQSNAEE